MALAVLPILFALTLGTAMVLVITRGQRLRWPFATIALTAVTFVIGTFAVFDEAVLDAVRPDPARFAAGEWWRSISALVAFEGGLFELIFSVVVLLLAGAVVENLVGPWITIAVYLIAGVVGQLAAHTFMPGQGYVGNSVALVGLAGAMIVTALVTGAGARFVGAIAVVPGILLIVAWSLHGLGFALGALIALVYFAVLQRSDRTRTI